MTICRGDMYEREIIRLFEDIDPLLYGQRGTHSDGVDVLLCKAYPCGTEVWRLEVKSARGATQSLKDTAHMWAQYQGYLEILRKYGISTYYAFRSKVRAGKGEKWRLFSVDDLPRARTGAPKLAVEARTGWTIRGFYDGVIVGGGRGV